VQKDIRLETSASGGNLRAIHKSAQIIMAREKGELDLIDRKMFTFLLVRAYSGGLRGDDRGVYRVPVSDILTYLNHSSTDRLNESLARLSSVNIIIDYVDDEGVRHSTGAHYLSYDMTKHADGWIHFAFDPILVSFIHNPKVYATLNPSAIRKFQSLYAAKLYEVMALHINRHHKIWEPSIEEFREFMGIGELYERYDNLRKRVIESAVEEVNAIAPFSVRVEDRRGGKGGKVIGLRFFVTPKGDMSLAAMVNPSLGIRTDSRNKKTRDKHTIDLLTLKTDAESDPLELSPETLSSASDLVNNDTLLEELITTWRRRNRGRRLPDPSRAFMLWLDATLAKQTDEALSLVDDSTVDALISQFMGDDL
jgi:Initiator Replication protein